MTASAIDRTDPASRRVYVLTTILFLSYLTVAMSLPAVPVHVVQGLGLSNASGGLAVGIAFLSTILTRTQSGARSDRIGGKSCMQQGLTIYAAAGLICLASSCPSGGAHALTRF
jgi:nitrate/nitrite transporter NarK